MSRVAELRRRRGEIADQRNQIVEAAEAQDRDLTPEETERFDQLGAEDAQLAARIDRLQAIEEPDEGDGDEPQRRTAPGNTGRAAVTGVKERRQDDPTYGFRNLGQQAIAAHQAATNPAAGVDERLRIAQTAEGLEGDTFPIAPAFRRGIAAGVQERMRGGGPLSPQMASGLAGDTGSTGGFLTSPARADGIRDPWMGAARSMLDMTDNYLVEGDSIEFKVNAETSRANGSRWGGVRGYWIAEGDQITSSKPKFDLVKLEPHEVAVLVHATNKLLRNATALGQYISRCATDELNFKVGDAVINGTGAGQPLGILAGTSGTSRPRVTVAKESNQAAGTIVAANIDNMWARLFAASRANSVWLINQDIEPQLQKLVVTAGVGGMPVYMPPGGLSAAPYATLKGRPVLPLEYCATLGTEGDIMLADMSAYAVGLKAGGVDEAMSVHFKFDTAESSFRFIFEVDGQPWIKKQITPYKGTNPLSPFVTLATRS